MYCNEVLAADSRTERVVNPLAWERGLVYLQCSQCNVWHKLKDNQGLVEEVQLMDRELP